MIRIEILNNTRRYIVSLATIIILAAVTFVLIIKTNKQAKPPTPYQNKMADTLVEKNIEVSVFQIENGWGYDIHVNGDRYIHQPMIPVVQGNKVFIDEADARVVAEFVADKIRRNIIPPTISMNELDSLGIQK